MKQRPHFKHLCRLLKRPTPSTCLQSQTARGLASYQLTTPEHAGLRNEIVALLDRASELPHSPPSLFLWREELEGRHDDDTARRVAILRRGVALHPDHARLRLRLAHQLLYRCRDNQGVAETLAPVLALPEPPPPELHWYLFEVARAEKNSAQALEHLDRLEVSGNVRTRDLLKLKGDVLLRCRRESEALVCYDQLAAEEGLNEVLLGLLGKASARLEAGETSEATALAEQATTRWFDEKWEASLSIGVEN